MKKFFAILAVAMVAISASAQTEQKSFSSDRFWDNWFVGVGGGVGAKTTNTNILENLNGLAGIKVGKWFNPRIGIRLDADAVFGNRPYGSNWAQTNQVTEGSWGTFVRWINAEMMVPVNMMNLIGGYKGETRRFEIIAAPGVGMIHSFASNSELRGDYQGFENMLTCKLALDLAYNLGKEKAWQVYLEPAITYALAGHYYGGVNLPNSEANYDIDRSFTQVTAGVVYKFGTANGTHNFTAVVPRSQAEIDGLNDQINGLKGQLNDKNRQVADLTKKLAEKPVVKEKVRDETNVVSNAATNVFFALNSTEITDPKDKVNLDAVAAAAVKSGSRVVIMGAADSKTGNPTINQRLADGRAESVKQYLVGKGVPADKITTAGEGGVDTLKPYPLNRRALVELK